MSFWNMEDGTNAAENVEKEYSAGGNDFEPLPKGTSVLVTIEDIAWKAAYQRDETFVNLKCRVLKPEGYANRVLFFKLWIGDLDPGTTDRAKALAKRDKHKKMFLTIDANAKGKMARLTAKPSDEELAVALTGAQFVATLGVWDKEDERGNKVPGGNWLLAAKPKSSEVSEGPQKAQAKRQAAFMDDDLDGDDVPF